MACLWQAWPDITASHLQLAVEESASQYPHPDSLMGYGVPDYAKAMLTLQVGIQVKNGFRVYPNPFHDHFTVGMDNTISGDFRISLISITGRIVMNATHSIKSGEGATLTLNNLSGLAPGMYILKISSGTTSEYIHLVKFQ